MGSQMLMLGEDEAVCVRVVVDRNSGRYVGNRPAQSFAPGEARGRFAGHDDYVVVHIEADGFRIEKDNA